MGKCYDIPAYWVVISIYGGVYDHSKLFDSKAKAERYKLSIKSDDEDSDIIIQELTPE